MDSRELRIGNLVKANFYEEPIRVDSVCDCNQDIFNKTTGEIPLTSIKPIPLTDEWLVKFGFSYVSSENGMTYYSLDGFDLLYSYGSWNFSPSRSMTLGVKIKYVHQLQNFYFALTQKELTIC